jgi:hypothetical protein
MSGEVNGVNALYDRGLKSAGGPNGGTMMPGDA